MSVDSESNGLTLASMEVMLRMMPGRSKTKEMADEACQVEKNEGETRRNREQSAMKLRPMHAEQGNLPEVLHRKTTT